MSDVFSIPYYDRVTSEIDTMGTKTIYYWDNRYSTPVHVETVVGWFRS